MLKIENTEVLGWEHAIRGMRNPMNSWEKSDSGFGCDYSDQHFCSVCEDGHTEACPNCFKQYKLGPNDLNLMIRLRNTGTDHRKFMRMITVYVDLTGPLYWWKEFDTYKVGTVANSCSTMHKIHAKEFTLEDFSHEHLLDGPGNGVLPPLSVLKTTIDTLNAYRTLYLSTNTKPNQNYVALSDEACAKLKKDIWWQMIQLLPTSYNQRRTVMLNYEVLANIYKSRQNHKLDEWRVHEVSEEHQFRNKDFASGAWGFCDWIESLPYSELIIGPAN